MRGRAELAAEGGEGLADLGETDRAGGTQLLGEDADAQLFQQPADIDELGCDVVALGAAQ